LVSSGWSTSVLPPEADIRRRIEHVCLVPEADAFGGGISECDLDCHIRVKVESWL